MTPLVLLLSAAQALPGLQWREAPVILVESQDFPYVTTQLHFQTGAIDDPPGKEGLAYLTSKMLLRGTAKMAQAEFAEAIDVLGASLEISVGREGIVIEAETLSATYDRLMELVADALRSPAFAQEELDKLKRQTLAEIAERRDNDEELSHYLFNQILYAPDPYGRPTSGTPDSLARITRDDVVAEFGRLFTRRSLVVGAAGAVDSARLLAILDKTVGGLPEGAPVAERAVTIADPKTIRVVLVDKPDRTQTQIWIGHSAIPVSHPDHYALTLANTVYGGTFTARLSHEIREKRGWSYGAYSYVQSQKRHGAFVFRFYPAMKDTVNALKLGLKLQKDLVANGVTQKELDAAKSYLVNNFPFRLETPQSRLGEKMRVELLGLPADYVETYVKRLQGTTLAEVNAAIKRDLKADQLTVVMTCTAKELLAKIKKLPGVGEVIVHPYDREWPAPTQP